MINASMDGADAILAAYLEAYPEDEPKSEAITSFLHGCVLAQGAKHVPSEILACIETELSFGCWIGDLCAVIPDARIPDDQKGFFLGAISMASHWLVAEHWHNERKAKTT